MVRDIFRIDVLLLYVINNIRLRTVRYHGLRINGSRSGMSRQWRSAAPIANDLYSRPALGRRSIPDTQTVPPIIPHHTSPAGTQVLQHHVRLQCAPDTRLTSLSPPAQNIPRTARVGLLFPAGLNCSTFSATWKQRASVLILLYGDSDGDLQVVLTTRSMKLRTHAGDVALPGGRPLLSYRREG